MGFFRFYFFLHKLLFLCHGQVFLLFNFTNECWSPLPSDTQDSLTLNLHQSLLYPHNIRKLLKGFHRQKKKKKNPTRPAKGSYVTMKSTGRFVNHRWIDTNSPKTCYWVVYWHQKGLALGATEIHRVQNVDLVTFLCFYPMHAFMKTETGSVVVGMLSCAQSPVCSTPSKARRLL
jgi:hypothetical protein